MTDTYIRYTQEVFTNKYAMEAAHEPPVKLGLRDGQRVLSDKRGQTSVFI
jgi:hypothetical protein